MPTGKLYGRSMTHLARNTWSWSAAHTIKVAFVRTDYVFNQDSHEFWSQVNTYESWSYQGAGDSTVGSGGAGLPQGGTTLTNKIVTYDPVGNGSRLDADNLVLTGVTHTNIGGIIVYNAQASAAASPLIGYYNISDVGQTSYSNVTLTLEWNSLGLFQIPVAE